MKKREYRITKTSFIGRYKTKYVRNVMRKDTLNGNAFDKKWKESEKNAYTNRHRFDAKTQKIFVNGSKQALPVTILALHIHLFFTS